MAWYKRDIFKTTLIGILLGIGFVIPPLWPLVLLGVGWSIDWFLRAKTWKRGIVGSVWMWTIKAFLSVSFFWATYPIEWLGLSLGTLEPAIVVFYWMTVSLWIGLGGGVFYILFKLLQKLVPAIAIWTIPLLWVLAEISGAFLFSVFTYGPGGSINTYFSFSYVGYLLGQHEMLIQLSAVAGVFGLTFITILMSLCAYKLKRAGYQKVLILGIVILIGTSQVQVFSQMKGGVLETKNVAVVNTTFPKADTFSEAGRERFKSIQTEAIDAALAADADYVILPEDSRFFDQSNDFILRGAAQRTLGDSSALVIDSGRVPVGGYAVLQAVVYDPTADNIYQSQKRYLVPQGEFLPYLYGSILKIAGLGQAVDFLNSHLSYQVGDDTDQSDFASNVPGILFCFENNSPTAVRTIMQERGGDVPFVAHVVSHAWFNEPTVLWQQIETMLRVQAIWNDIAIVSAGNHVQGYQVDKHGNVSYPEIIAQGKSWQVGLTPVEIR